MKHSHVPVFILAGGLGTRLSEETQLRPKPMVEIGDLPILIHIMRSYYSYGFDDFIICAGYKSWEIKNYFLNYSFRSNHLLIDHRKDSQSPPATYGSSEAQEAWRVRVLDTGNDSMTGARLARAFDLISRDQKIENFAVTYGDGLSNVDLEREFEFHISHGRLGSVLGVHAVARFGVLELSASKEVTSFLEKPEDQRDTINGGFFFFREGFRSFLDTEASCILEKEPLEKLTRQKQFMCFPHGGGFWQPMDTLRDRQHLEDLWKSGRAPWLRKPKPRPTPQAGRRDSAHSPLEHTTE